MTGPFYGAPDDPWQLPPPSHLSPPERFVTAVVATILFYPLG